MKADIESVVDELTRIEDMSDKALQAVNRDRSSSSALRAVVEELHNQARKALDDSEEAEEPLREHIVELEQAADCAKVAALAETTLSEPAREAILLVHEEVSGLKADTTPDN